MSTNLRLWHYSGVTQTEPWVEYAAVVIRKSAVPDATLASHRPTRLLVGEQGQLWLEDPLHPERDEPFDEPGWDVLVVGYWDQPGLWPTSERRTWRQAASHQTGQVLRQRALADRLTDFGIPRSPEPYLPHQHETNAVERSLTLTYDELDRLLRAAGF